MTNTKINILVSTKFSIRIEVLSTKFSRYDSHDKKYPSKYCTLCSSTDHVLASHTTFFNFQVHRSDFVHVTTRTSHDDGFIEIGAGFIVHGFSLFPARRFFYNGFSCWIQFNRRTSENHYVFTRTKKTVLQFL